MKMLAVSLTLCTILTISQAGPINSTTSWDGGLCAYKMRYCSNLIGSFCPKCDASGNFLPQQCSGSTGYCWCVNVMTGTEIPNTKTPPGVMPVNCKKDSYCPDGWSQFGERCFTFISSPKTWTEAQIYCQFDGGNLASIHSYEENYFVQSLTRGDTHDFPETWIGGTDAIHPSIWMWIDGSKFYYENWHNNDHDDTDDHDDHDHHYDTDDHDHHDTDDHDHHHDTDDHDHHHDTDDHDHHHDTDDHDHHYDTDDHDHHHDTDDHDHHHDTNDNGHHYNTNDHDNSNDTNDHDNSNDTNDEDNNDDTHDDDHHYDTNNHDHHYDTGDHHNRYKRTGSCLKMNCHYKLKWCTAACDDSFPFVCSKNI